MQSASSQSFETRLEVIFRDVDAMGHVNNAVYFTYMETARTKFFRDLLGLDKPTEMPVIVAEASCTYKSAARFGEQLVISVTVARIGTKSFDLDYLISSSDGRAVATGKTVMVAYDYAGRRTIPIPSHLRSLLEELLTNELVAQ